MMKEETLGSPLEYFSEEEGEGEVEEDPEEVLMEVLVGDKEVLAGDKEALKMVLEAEEEAEVGEGVVTSTEVVSIIAKEDSMEVKRVFLMS